LRRRLVIAGQAEPGEIGADRVGDIAARAPGVDVLDPEAQASTALAHGEPRGGGGTDVAEMQPPRRRRRQPSDDHWSSPSNSRTLIALRA